MRRSAKPWSQRGLRCAPSRRWSAIERLGYTGASWARKPTRASCSVPEPGVLPSTLMLPEVGVRMPQASLSSVDLPAPFGPTRPTTWPGGMFKVQSASARRRP